MNMVMMTKVDEALNGKWELSMDEAAQVVGGDTNYSVYKRDGGYYIKSEALGNAEMTLHEFAEIVWGIYNNFGVEVALAWLNDVAPNPHNEEILRVYEPWEIVDHYQRHLDGTNPYYL